jgi:hypothetical protein
MNMQAARNRTVISGMTRLAKQMSFAREPSCRCAAQIAYGEPWGRVSLTTNTVRSRPPQFVAPSLQAKRAGFPLALLRRIEVRLNVG